jgi:hypothetical protein
MPPSGVSCEALPLTRRPLDLELQTSRPLNVCSPHTPRLVGRRVQGCCAPLENGAEVTIAVITLEANRGETIGLSSIQDQGEGPEVEGRHPVALELGLQPPDTVEPVEGCREVAYTEVNVVEVHRAVTRITCDVGRRPNGWLISCKRPLTTSWSLALLHASSAQERRAVRVCRLHSGVGPGPALQSANGMNADHELLLGELSLEVGAQLPPPAGIQLLHHDFVHYHLLAHGLP